MFQDLRIKSKLLFSYSIVFILSITLGNLIIYPFVRATIEENIESELEKATTLILSMVETSAASSIRNYLRAIGEKNHEIVRSIYGQYRDRRLSEAQAKSQAAAVILSQTIGKSGYLYCIDSRGLVVVHPRASLIDTDVSGHAFVRKQMEAREGYIEYDWRNPGETRSRPKALYMVYFEPWDWIISASAYRDEFRDLVDVKTFEGRIQSLKFGEGGYSFVMDTGGRPIVQPRRKGEDVFQSREFQNVHLKEMIARKKGKILYFHPNPKESAPRTKLLIFHYLPEYGWIVGSSTYLDEIFRPLQTVRNLILATALISLLLVLPLTFKLSASITRPLQRLMRRFESAGEGDFTTRLDRDADDEIGHLVTHFNRFMDQLESYSQDLKEQIRERRRTEAALRESEDRHRTVMEAAPDPIVVYDMTGRVIIFNPAFERVFGWSLAESQGRKLDHFVPEENRPETEMMIRMLMAGETLSSIESRRYARCGDVINVSISGATYRDRLGGLAGSVIILRDITEKRRLARQVLDIGDRERQAIGQDLHDDLCPHLIGIQGLIAVLGANLSDSSVRNRDLAEKILNLMTDAIQKTRVLARGLCPVHLVSNGLQFALDEMIRGVQASSGIVCQFISDERIVIADNTTATHIYYIAREALTNAVKHSRAGAIYVSLYQEENRIQLRVSDDGMGFSEGRPAAGMGLQIMRYRATMIGASFEIRTRPGFGTDIRAGIPKRTPPFSAPEIR